MAPLSELTNDFLASLNRGQRLSQRTVRNYKLYLKRFEHWLGQQVHRPPELTDVIRQTMARYARWLGSPKPRGGLSLAVPTRTYHLIALRRLLRFLAGQGVTVELPKLPNAVASRQSALTSIELNQLLEAPGRTTELEIVKLRDRAILEFLVGSGLKVSEIVALQRSDLPPERDYFTFRRGRHARTVMLSHQSRFHLQRYLKQRRDKGQALFVRHDRALRPGATPRALTARSVQRILERYRQLAGLNRKITPQTLRHTYARRLLQAGVEMRTVQNLLGHASITTTQLYTH